MSRIAALSALTLAAAVQYASATLGVTYPIASTTCKGNDACGSFTWKVDDSVLPLAAEFGRSTVGIYTGSTTQQTVFLDLGTVSDPTKITEIKATTIPATLGPNGDFYFLRIESVSATDPVSGYPLQAFSAKFSLTGMTGELSDEAEVQVDGTSATTRASTTRSTSTARSAVSMTSSGSSSNPSKGLNTNSNAQKNTTGISSNSTDTGAALPAYVQNMGFTVAIGVGLAGAALFAY